LTGLNKPDQHGNLKTLAAAAAAHPEDFGPGGAKFATALGKAANPDAVAAAKAQEERDRAISEFDEENERRFKAWKHEQDKLAKEQEDREVAEFDQMHREGEQAA
jgi:hypothetical protein